MGKNEIDMGIVPLTFEKSITIMHNINKKFFINKIFENTIVDAV